MTPLLAITSAEARSRLAILAIFALTYLSIAIGRVPGLKLNRISIALLGAIGMTI